MKTTKTTTVTVIDLTGDEMVVTEKALTNSGIVFDFTVNNTEQFEDQDDDDAESVDEQQEAATRCSTPFLEESTEEYLPASESSTASRPWRAMLVKAGSDHPKSTPLEAEFSPIRNDEGKMSHLSTLEEQPAEAETQKEEEEPFAAILLRYLLFLATTDITNPKTIAVHLPMQQTLKPKIQ